jgi:hypothetical protein
MQETAEITVVCIRKNEVEMPKPRALDFEGCKDADDSHLFNGEQIQSFALECSGDAFNLLTSSWAEAFDCYRRWPLAFVSCHWSMVSKFARISTDSP